ncbi:MAG: hypothetical protein CMQ26_02190 [Gammaproteobacteria bacterium]|nr:hypothetical protein [Gammaproteobacteria bacterium]
MRLKKKKIPIKKQQKLLKLFQENNFVEAEMLAKKISENYPDNYFSLKVLGAIFHKTERFTEAIEISKKAIKINPDDSELHNNLGVILQKQNLFKEAEASYKKALLINPSYTEAYNNLGNTYKELGEFDESLKYYKKAISLKPNFAEAHNNIGQLLIDIGKLEEAESHIKKSIELNPNYPNPYVNLGDIFYKKGKLSDAKLNYQKAISIKPDFIEAYNNLGNAFAGQAKLKDAESNYKKALEIHPSFLDSYWNLSSLSKTIIDAESYLNKFLEIDNNPEIEKNKKVIFMKAALKFYQGEETSYNNLMKSDSKNHYYLRSFKWVFELDNLPELYFNKWQFFDAIIKKSNKSRPFYEFGVWRAASFKYLIDAYKVGYGFDTFSGLPEDWKVGENYEKAGSYSSEGDIPDIEGGEFIVGKFQDSFPIFFSKQQPIASVINYDADLYSSTSCALNFSKSVIDKDTILIFDEFIMNENWEQDEFKALNEFCYNNKYTYNVLAVSFFSKQVAVKLIQDC